MPYVYVPVLYHCASKHTAFMYGRTLFRCFTLFDDALFRHAYVVPTKIKQYDYLNKDENIWS